MTEARYLIDGPISAQYIADVVSKHSSKTDIGGIASFIGQVRADQDGKKEVIGIDYSAYPEMVTKALDQIKEDLFQTYDDLKCIHIAHSIGFVKAGEISLHVFIAGAHRKDVFPACRDCVDMIKDRVPVWKKEMLSDDSHRWLDH